MQPQLAAFQMDKSQDVRRYFNLDERESKLEGVMNYANSLMNSASTFGAGPSVSSTAGEQPRQSGNSIGTRPYSLNRVRVPTRHSSRRNHLNEATVRGLSQRHHERNQRFVSHLQSMAASVRQMNTSLQQIRGLRRNNNK